MDTGTKLYTMCCSHYDQDHTNDINDNGSYEPSCTQDRQAGAE